MKYLPRAAKVRTGRAVAGLAAAAGLVLAGVAGGVPQASAAQLVSESWGQQWVGAGGAEHLITYNLLESGGNTVQAVCANPSKQWAGGMSMSDSAPVASWVNDQGVALTPVQLAELAYVGAYYSAITSDQQAEAINLAVRDLMGYTAVSAPGASGPLSFDLTNPSSYGYQAGQALGVLANAQAIVAAAQAGYSTWDGTTVDWSSNSNSVNVGGTYITDITLPGVPAGTQFVLSADGTDVASGSADSTGHATLSWVVPTSYAGQTVNLTIRMVGTVPAALPSFSFPTNPSMQSMLALNGVSLPWSDPDGIALTVTKLTPAVSTAPQSLMIAPGSQDADVVSITGCFPGQAQAGTVDVYDGFASDAAVAAADTSKLSPVGTATFSGVCGADGTATLTSTPVVFPNGGLAFFDEHLADNATQNGVDASPADRNSETVFVFAPAVSTTASSQVAATGVQVSDSLKASGMAPTVGGVPVVYKITGRVASFATGLGVCTGINWDMAQTAFSFTVDQALVKPDAGGNLALSGLGPIGGDGRTCLSWSETVTATLGGVTLSYTHPLGSENQTTLVADIAAAAAGIEAAPADTAPAPVIVAAPAVTTANTGGAIAAGGVAWLAAGFGGVVTAGGLAVLFVVWRRRLSAQAG